ncbi:MAG: efflux RND transporter periplasmic adaptor subunit [Gemmatimonadaceae bacterium]
MRGVVVGAAAVAVAVLVGVWVLRPGTSTADLAVATRGPLQVTLDVDGVTRVRSRITVKAPVRGLLLSTRLEAGDAVRRGDPLFTISTGRNPAALSAAGRVFVRAPLTGRVLRVREPHEQLVSRGTPLMDVGDPRDMEVIAHVPPANASDVRDGEPMQVRRQDVDTPLLAVVTRVDSGSAANPSEPPPVDAHGAFTSTPRGLSDGARVTVSIVLWSGADVVRVPRTALVAVKGGWEVFRVTAGRARPVVVTVGHRGASDAEVVSGLTEGDTVVALPDEHVRAGTRMTGEVWAGGS